MQAYVEEQVVPDKLVPAVERAIRILLTFEDGGTTYGVSDLSRRLGIHKSTVYDILNTLTYFDFLERDDESKKYRLGPALFRLGNRVGAQLGLRDAARSYLRDLAADLEQTVILSQLTVENDILTVDAVVPEVAVAISTSVGRRLPHSAGALGKTFHAALPHSELEAMLVKNGLRRFTDRTIVEPALYRDELARVRQQGYAIDDEEYLQGVRALAAPVVDRDGCVAAALCVVGFNSTMTRSTMHDLIGIVPATAREISSDIGASDYPSWDGIRRVAV